MNCLAPPPLVFTTSTTSSNSFEFPLFGEDIQGYNNNNPNGDDSDDLSFPQIYFMQNVGNNHSKTEFFDNCFLLDNVPINARNININEPIKLDSIKIMDQDFDHESIDGSIISHTKNNSQVEGDNNEDKNNDGSNSSASESPLTITDPSTATSPSASPTTSSSAAEVVPSSTASSLSAMAAASTTISKTASIVERPGPYDILFGRGKSFQTNPGNERLRQLLEKHKPTYQASTSRTKKAEIIKSAIEELKQPVTVDDDATQPQQEAAPRFLRLGSSSTTSASSSKTFWYEADPSDIFK